MALDVVTRRLEPSPSGDTSLVEFLTLAQQCAPDVHPATMAALVRTESGFNPYAIGVVAGRLERQPTTLDEAVATAEKLQRDGFNASFGLGQVNLHNLARFSLDVRSVFDPCQNLRASAAILAEAYARARRTEPNEQKALRSALSMYYSGNPVTGVSHGYVARVVGNAGVKDTATPAGPAAPIAVIRNASGVAPSRVASVGGSTAGRPREPAASTSASGNGTAPVRTAATSDAASARGKGGATSEAFRPKPMW
jgi:type IV secretion system protein VirB1